MNPLGFLVRTLKTDLNKWIVNLSLLAFGVAGVVCLRSLESQVASNVLSDARNIDMVAGARGSALQIIMSAVFQLDVPTGNITQQVLSDLKTNRGVKLAVPVSMGDSFSGFRVIGTTPDYLELFPAEFAGKDSQIFKSAFDAVLGAEVAASSKLRIGDTFVGSHGLGNGGEQHAQFPYKVVGILAATGGVVDRVILTPLESVWAVHEAQHHHAENESDDEAGGPHTSHHHHDEKDHDHDTIHANDRKITAVLIKFSSPLSAAIIPRMVNDRPDGVTAAVPAVELTRLTALFRGVAGLISGGAFLLIALSMLGFILGLYRALRERKRELASMRALGASRAALFSIVFGEGTLLSFSGAVLGVFLGHFLLWIVQLKFSLLGTRIDAWQFTMDDVLVAGAALTLGILISSLPAFSAGRINVIEALNEK